MIDNIINGYKILSLLGKGGMADVYYAENKLKRPAAIKILQASLSSQHEVKLRFESEAQITVSLDHPNIRKVYDVDEIDGRPAIIMEYLEGNTLSEALTNRLLDSSILPDLLNQAVSGLQYAHQKGIVHRDIKPSNLFLTKGGQLKILDFGIAKAEEASSHTLTGQTLGTILYMSPEQIQDPKRVDYKTDIYSLGVTFYHLLTGKPPYNATTDSIFNIQTKIVREDLDLNSLSLDWKHRLADCLVKQPKDRTYLQNDSFSTLMDLTVPKSIPNSSHIIVKTKIRLRWKKIMYLIAIIVLILASIIGVRKMNYILEEKRRDRFYKSLQDKYDSVGVYWDTLIRVRKNNKYGFVNEDGKEVIPLIYDYVGSSFSENLVEAAIGGKYGYIDRNGSINLPFIFEFAEEFSEGLAGVKSGGLFGYIDTKGDVIIEFKFEEAFPFNSGRARVMRRTSKEVWIEGQNRGSGSWEIGYIDKSGSIVIPYIYRLGWDFSNGKTEVTTFEGEVFQLDTFGNSIKIGNAID